MLFLLLPLPISAGVVYKKKKKKKKKYYVFLAKIILNNMDTE